MSVGGVICVVLVAAVVARVINPEENGQNLTLKADETRAGTFVAVQ